MFETDRTKWDPNRVLYKYLDAEGALKTIDGCSVKCTSPYAFNDPYDTTTELRLGFDIADLPDIIAKQIEDFVFSDAPQTIEAPTDLGLAILSLRKIGPGLVKGLRLDSSAPSVAAVLNDMIQQLESDKKSWRDFLRTWRIFCLSKRNDNLLLWAHYADSHRGVVIGFKCVPEEDSCFCVAEPVRYLSEIPVMATPAEWFRDVTGIQQIDIPSRLLDLTLAKSDEWKYEEEFRYVLPALNPVSNPNYDIRAISPSEVHSVYFGCRIDSLVRSKLMDKLKGNYPHVRIFQAKQSTERFGLDFDLIE